MIGFRPLVIIIVLAFHTVAQGVRTMDKMADFKQKSGISDFQASGLEAGIVCADWRTILSNVAAAYPGMQLHGYPPRFDQPDIMSAEWKLFSDSIEVMIDIHCTNDCRTALNLLVDLASLTTMASIPYKKNSVPIGDFALCSLSEPPLRVFWVYRNAVIDISLVFGKFDLRALAPKMQVAIKPFVLEFAKVYPPMLKDQAQKVSVKVGENALISYVTAPEERQYQVSAFVDGESIQVLDFDSRSVRIKGIKAGTGSLIIVNGDPQTLLSNSLRVGVQVVAP